MFEVVRAFQYRWIAVGVVLTAGIRAADDPVTSLKAAIAAVEAKRYPAAVATLKDLKVPKLADYRAWYLASAQFELKNYAEAIAALEPIWKHEPVSPFHARAVLLAADAYLKSGQPKESIRIVGNHYPALTAPQGEMAMADAYAAMGDKGSAAVYYQRVYYGYPQSPAAPRAGLASEKLRVELGDAYPPVLAHALLGRATKLLDAGQTAAARKEFAAIIPKLGSEERAVAQVRSGVALYKAEQNSAAFSYLRDLAIDFPEADAERLNYLSQSARRLDRLREMSEYAMKAAEKYPSSPYTVDALTAAGNRYLTTNDVASYEPLYRACYRGMPGDPRTDPCHWKVTWAHYLRRDADAGTLLLEHLKLYPSSGQSSSALYFLGRLAEQASDHSRARVLYEAATVNFPNQFYTLLSEERLTKLPVAGTATVDSTLKDVVFARRPVAREFEMNSATLLRVERARMLAQANMIDLAENELRYGADRPLGEQPHVLAVELGKLTGKDNPAQALRYVKRYVSGYLGIEIEDAPREFWRQAFPLPYRTSLEEYSKESDVDPFLLAGLIRQESEFDARVVSRAGARGLTQIKPSTGGDIAKHFKVPFSAAKLFQPETNLRFGAYYLKLMTTTLNGNEFAALAAYNAGLSRAQQWLKWGDFREPAEFIETIPLTETRGYVQAVMRNAATYRAVYGMEARASAE